MTIYLISASSLPPSPSRPALTQFPSETLSIVTRQTQIYQQHQSWLAAPAVLTMVNVMAVVALLAVYVMMSS